MGLDVYLRWPSSPKATTTYPDRREGHEGETHSFEHDADIPSVAYPDHMFKRNYLRSSYNDGGINHVLGATCEGRDLYWIFAPVLGDADGGDLRPSKAKLDEALERAKMLLGEFRSREALRVSFESSTNLFSPSRDARPTTEEAAMAVYRSEVAKERPPDFSSFGNAAGAFYLGETPLKVRALIKGLGPLRNEGFWIVYEDDSREWYVQALEIVVEFIEEALSHPRCTIHWSA